MLFEDFSFNLPPGSIVDIIGPNGAGKTTLCQMMVGTGAPDEGTLRLGDSVQLAYVDQSRDTLPDDQPVWAAIADGESEVVLGDAGVNARACVAAFNFRGPDQQKALFWNRVERLQANKLQGSVLAVKALTTRGLRGFVVISTTRIQNRAQQKPFGQLSGGERNRVHLARLLRSGASVILLDEPTNDLDVETLRALEDALLEFAGCAVIVSHDRWFLDRVCTHIISFESDSNTVWFEGNVEAYEADRIRRLGHDAVIPRRIQYRKFSRH